MYYFMGNYIDLDFFQRYTQTTYDATTTPTDTTVNELIDLSEQEINERTGRNWGVITHTSELYDIPKKDLLLKNTPVLSVTSIVDDNGDTLTEGIDDDYLVDNDFITFYNLPDRALITYTSGYTSVRAAAIKLTTLLTLQKIKQGTSSTQDNTESITVGPISLTSSIGASAVVNLDSDTDRYWKELRRLVR